MKHLSSTFLGFCLYFVYAFANAQTIPTTISISISKADVLCFGQNNGYATASASGGTSPYTYKWSNNMITATATNLYSGNYVVTVTDAASSTATAQVIINQPTALVSNAVVSNAKCLGTNTGSISLVSAGGIPPYLYSLNGSVATTSGNFGNLQAGFYSGRVTDFNGCVSNISTINVSQPLAVNFSATTVDAKTVGGTDGTITITASGGTPAYQYSKDGLNFQSLNTFTGLSAGTYTITVKDINACSKTQQVTVSQPSSLQLSATKISPNCQQSNGAINLMVSGGTSPYNYLWSNGSTTEDLSNLAQGTYTVTVTDAANATATTSVSLSWTGCRFDLALKMVPKNPAQQIKIGDDVTFVISVYNQGTIAASNIQIVDYIPVGMTLNHPAWTAVGAMATLSTPIPFLAIGAFAQIEITLKVNEGIYGIPIINNAEISSATNALNLRDFDSNPDTTPFNDAGGKAESPSDDSIIGNGTGVVGDLNATTDEDDADPAAIRIFTPNLVVNVSAINNLCNGDSNGSANANIASGVSPYTYLWSTGSTSSSISGLVAGTYSLTVTDNLGRTATSTVSITQPSVGSIITTATNLTCNSLGSVSIAASGGSGIYLYSLNSQDYQSNNTFSGLDAGTYTFIVKDNNECFIGVETVNILSHVPLDVALSATNFVCGSKGNIIVNATGGNSPYTYQLNSNGFQTDNTFSGLDAGDYTITVKDANACEKVSTINIMAQNSIGLSAKIGDCIGSDGGQIIATTAITLNMAFKLNNGTYQIWREFNNLPTGNYTVFAKDTSTGCIDSVKVFMPEGLKIALNTQNILCKGANNGKITISSTGGKTTNYQYKLNNGAFQSSNIFSNLLVGNYTITVLEGLNCIATATTIITEPTKALSVTATTKNVSCGGGNDGTITLTIAGGTTVYGTKQLLKNNQIVQTLSASQGMVFQNVAAGSYVIKVFDANNCEASTNAVLTQPTALVLNVSSNNITCFDKNNGLIAAEIKNGISPFIFSLSGPKNQIKYCTVPTNYFDNLPQGTYQLTVRDKRGCAITKTIVITQPTKLNLTLAATPTSKKVAFDGKITATATGGTLPYLFQLNNSVFQSNNVFSNLKTGTYYVIVKDKGGCKSQASIIVPIATTSLATDINLANSATLVMSPNPIESDNLTIKVDTQEEDDVVVDIIDSKGKLAIRKELKISSVDAEIIFDISSLERADNYIVNVYSAKKVYGKGRLMRLK